MTRTVTITERRPAHDDWAVTASGATTYYPTAMQAYTAIRRQDRAAVTAGADRAVTVITWAPTTEAGTAVVSALTGQWR
jgi:hypothetical protein